MIGIAVITHGHFGEELVRTAEEIVGRQEHLLAFSVTSETSVDNAAAFLDGALLTFRALDGVLILVDMLGGTPGNVAILKTKDSAAEIVTGVNLYMLVSAMTHRSQLDARALALKVAEDGKRAITL